MEDLTEKQKRFCEEYVIDSNGTQAAIRAGYSENSAQQIATENLLKPVIQNYLSKLQSEIRERNKIKADDVVQELAKLGFSNIKKLFNDDGTMKKIHELNDDVAASISSIKVQEVKDLAGMASGVLVNIPAETKEIKLWDKKGSLELLGKHLGIFEKDNKQKHTEFADPELIKVLIQEIAPEVYKKFEIKKNEEEYLAKCEKWGV